MSPYFQPILKRLNKMGRVDCDPRHVEAWMRVSRGTLDSLAPREFASEVRAAVACIDLAGKTESEQLAESYEL